LVFSDDSVNNADKVNTYFANIATDASYSATAIQSEASCDTSIVQSSAFAPVSLVDVERMLCKLKRSSGDDGIPFWVYNEIVSELAPVITVHINYSLTKSIVLKQWRHAVVTPIPKTSVISGMNNLRRSL
jgi:hypothetical protein